jgi:hypothetical protein
VLRRLRVLRVLRVLRPTDAAFRFGFGGWVCSIAGAADDIADAARWGTAFHSSSRSAASALRETRPKERIPRSDVIVTP